MRHFDGDIRTGLTKGLKHDLTQEAVIKKKNISLSSGDAARHGDVRCEQTDRQTSCLQHSAHEGHPRPRGVIAVTLE